MAGCDVHHRVYRAEALPEGVEGIDYWLPRTKLRISIPMTYEFSRPKDGFTAADVAKVLGKPFKELRRLKAGDPTIATIAVPDPKQHFVVQITGRLFEKRKLTAKLTADGLLTESNSSASETITPFVKSIIEDVAGVAGRVSAAGSMNLLNTSATTATTKTPDERQKVVDDAAKAYADLTQKRDAVIDAARTAGSIAETIKFLIADLDAQIVAVVSRVADAGAESWTATFDVDPDDVDPEQLNCADVAASLEPKGYELMVVNGNAVGAPVNGAVVLQTPIPSALQTAGAGAADLSFKGPIRLTLTRIATSIAHIDPAKRTDVRGYYYRQPGRAIVRVYVGDEAAQRAFAEIRVAQFGVVRSLPSSPGGGASNYSVTLDADTGALVGVEVGSEPPTTQAIDAAFAAPKTADDARNAALTAEKTRLQLEDDVRKLRAGESLTPAK